ncbi:hypothetical protein [Streptomyces sp. Da 82-17]|uniref:hypothetical protein n=1 Tax=Streptomyces sp. Da 82-17 TaxID=3377116 RepID=UPI0038D4E93B
MRARVQERVRRRGAAGVLAVACTVTATTAVMAVSAPGAWAQADGARTAPGAVADNSGWRVSVTPTTVKPGGQVTLSSSGCQVPTVTVDAPIFDPVELNEGQSATAHVYPDAKPGAEYEVTFTCNGKPKSVPLMIAGGQGHTGGQTGGHTGGHTAGHTAGHTGGLHHGVKAGAGGTFADVSPTQLALGGALVAGVIGFTLLQVRRSRGGGAE